MKLSLNNMTGYLFQLKKHYELGRNKKGLRNIFAA